MGRRRPIILIACIALAAATDGCIYIPNLGVQYRSDAVGTTPDAPLRLGVANRGDAFRTFGDAPDYRTEHDRAVGYAFDAIVGRYWGLKFGPCMPYCGSTYDGIPDDVWMEFDDAGTLTRYERRLSLKYDGSNEKAWAAFVANVPDRPLPKKGPTRPSD